MEIKEITTREFVMKHAIACVCNKENELNTPVREIPNTDLVVYARVIVDSKKSYKPTQSLLREILIDEDELIDRAIENAKAVGFEVVSLASILGNDDYPDMPYVIRNESGMWGAAGILGINTLREAGIMLGSREFYILPSSIHEVLVVKGDVGDVDFLREMVAGINESEVRPEDFLSNNVYYFDGEEIRIAE